MKTIIAGSRTIINGGIVTKAIGDSGFEITEVVSGHALGVDRAGEGYALLHGLKVTLFIPDWERYGKSAGMIRNAEMANYADALIAIWDGKSRGTKNMIDNATKKGLKTFVYILPPVDFGYQIKSE